MSNTNYRNDLSFLFPILDLADLTPKELEDIICPCEEFRNPFDPQENQQRSELGNFLGETFRVMKVKEIKQYGEYRTHRLVLEAWDRLEGVEPVQAQPPFVAQQPPVDTNLEKVPNDQVLPKPARRVNNL